MASLVLVKEIRQVRGGFIVEARWPYGPNVSGYGEVICNTLEEVFELIRQCALKERV